MKKKLVTYFSASGITAKAAETLAQALQADLYQIQPAHRYTDDDLNWHNKQSRSSLEMNDPAARPVLKEMPPDLTDYDTIFIGFPIWWYTAPRIILSFLEACDLAGKKIAPFATSGGSGMGQITRDIAPSCPDAQVLSGKLLNGRLDTAKLSAWANNL